MSACPCSCGTDHHPPVTETIHGPRKTVEATIAGGTVVERALRASILIERGKRWMPEVKMIGRPMELTTDPGRLYLMWDAPTVDAACRFVDCLSDEENDAYEAPNYDPTPNVARIP